MQDEAFAEQCKANGQEVRQPDEAECIALVIADEQEELKRDLREITGRRHPGERRPVQGEAQFVVKDGQPTIQLPKHEVFEDIHQQASSLVHAPCHAHLHKAAVGRAECATAAGHTDEAVEARVAAYNLKPSERAKSDEFSKADLAATYAAVNRTTAMPAE